MNYLEEINFKNILKIIKPDDSERKEIMALSDELIRIINEIANDHSIPAEAVMVGSVAKGTWLSGKADIDIFIKFPLDLSEDYLKKCGLFLGYECIKKMNGESEERYASHPYVTGFIRGFKIDFVPCYDIKTSEQLKSAVDRTILHTEYVKKNLKPEQINEVLLLKTFMESLGTYGSEFKVGGFSGYLCELLIIHYKSFLEALNAASKKWHPNYIIDIENYGTGNLFHDPLIFIDPVDKNRNVAAPLTLQRMSEFVVASRSFIENPRDEYFFQKIPKVDINSIKEQFKKRNTKTLLIIFSPPEIPADALYPQLNKTVKSLKSIVEREDFRVFGSEYWTDEDKIAIILLEFDIWEIPRIKKHRGPYVWSKNHQRRFLDKYKDKAWVEQDRLIVEVERKHRTVESLFKDILQDERRNYLKFGKHVKEEILKHYQIMDIQKFLESKKCDNAVLMFLCHYLNKSMNIWA